MATTTTTTTATATSNDDVYVKMMDHGGTRTVWKVVISSSSSSSNSNTPDNYNDEEIVILRVLHYELEQGLGFGYQPPTPPTQFYTKASGFWWNEHDRQHGHGEALTFAKHIIVDLSLCPLWMDRRN
jgi:hypothetical protein